MNTYLYDDSLDDTQPSPADWVTDQTQPTRVVRSYDTRPVPRRRRWLPTGCFSILLAGAILLGIYFLLPLTTNLLLLGTDSRDPESMLGRTDSLILTSIIPTSPEINMLSIPRDLWVTIPVFGENRVNAAYFLAEAENPGSGIAAVRDTIEINFGVRMDYYVLVNFGGLVNIIDALGGLEIDIPRPMSGYTEGKHLLDGTQALAFVRDRTGSDDFFRMERGQIFIRALILAFLKPATIARLTVIVPALLSAIETDLPAWQLPRLGLALARSGTDGIRSEVITREMTTAFTTDAGASVLLPNWDVILPLVNELFK